MNAICQPLLAIQQPINLFERYLQRINSDKAGRILFKQSGIVLPVKCLLNKWTLAVNLYPKFKNIIELLSSKTQRIF